MEGINLFEKLGGKEGKKRGANSSVNFLIGEHISLREIEIN